MIPRTGYLHDALDALVRDHLDRAVRVLAEPGDRNTRIAIASDAITDALHGIAVLQQRHGVSREWEERARQRQIEAQRGAARRATRYGVDVREVAETLAREEAP